jgi:hypothetical protein
VNRFTLFNSSNNSPVGDGSLAIYNNSLADYHMVLLSSGNTAIRKTTAAAPLDVNGLALASNMGAPQAQFSTLGAEFLVASTFGVRVLGASSFTTSTATLAASATIPQLFVSSISSATLTASNVSTLTLQANLATVSTLSTIGNVNVGSNLTVGSSTLVANVASNTVQMNAPLTQGRRLRLNLISGTGTFSLGYATDLNTNFTYVSGLITGGARGFATNGDIIVAFGNGGSTTPFATSYDGVNWTGGSSNLFTSVARVIWDGRRFVAVGTGSSTYAAITSPDGFNWSEVTTAPVVTGNTFALGFNGSLYVVGFSQGAVYTTPDLVTWTQRTSQFSSNVRAILWTRFNWIMGGNGTNRFASSPDGITWTPITALNTLITANTARTFAVNGSTVVVGGWTTGSPGTGIIAYSLNSGTTWTQADLTTNSVNFTTIEAIWWTGAYYVASGTSSTGGLAATSVDGLVWSPLSVSFTSGAHGGLAINYTTTLRQTTFGLLAADSISTAGTLTVSDVFRVGDSTIVSDPLRKNTGINCNAPRYSLDVNGNINAAGFLLNGEAFTGGGGVSSNVSTSRFLTSSIVTSSLNTSVTAILSNSQRSNYFVGSIQRANNSGVLLRSLDGITWATVTNPNANFAAFTYLYNGSQWIMGGTVSGGISSALYTSPDGSNWTSVVQTGYANQYVFTIGWNGSYYLIGGLDGTAGPANSNTRCLTRTTDFTTFTPATNQVFTGGACRAVAWNGTLWVAVGTDSFVANVTQAIKYSFDGVTWTNIPSGGFTSTSSAQGLCVLWNGRMFVAGGQESAAAAGAVMKYSYDGIAWFDCVGPVGRAAAARSVNGIGWNGRRFVAVGEGAGFTSSILYSDDGISWQYANGTFSGGGSRVAWNGSRWVASGSDSTAAKVFQYSSDGITWTNGSGLTETSPFTVAVAATSNVFPDAQIGNTYFYNGQQPNFITNLSTTNTVQQFSNALLINELYTENNGFTGINCNAPQTALAVNGFATFNKTQDPLTIVFAVNRNTSTVTTSINNGSNWFYPPGTSPLQYGTTACWDGRRFLLAASSAASSTDLYTSSNGINWSPVTISGTFQNSLVNAMIWTGVNYIAVGRSTANSNAMICRSVDGSNWTAATSGGFSPVATQAQGFDVAYDGRTLVAVGIDDTGASIKRSTDNGATWTNATAGAFSAYIQNVNVFGGRGVATNGRVWVAVGADASASSTIKYSTNSGSNWNSVPSGGFSGGGGAVAWNGRYFLATGNDTANGVQYSLDGINWMGVSWPSATYSGIGNIIWTGTEWRMSGNLVSGGLAYTVTATGDLPPVMGTPTTFAGTSTANDLACSSNVYPDFQVENLAIYGRNQYPMNLSTNFIYLNSNGMNLNNLLLLSNNADALTAQNGTLRVAAAQTVFNVLNYASNGVSSTRALLRLTQSGGTFLFQSGSNETGNSRANMAFVPMYTGAAGANLFLDMVNSRVGVGTSAPSATLHISNTATIASNVLQVSASTTQLYFGKGSSEDKTFVQLSDDGAVDAFKYGTLQITRPGNPVDGKFHISMIRQGNMVAGLGYLSNTNTFLISTNGAALYLASDAGKVGLNQSNPTYPLTVSYNNSAGGYLESGILISNASATNSAQLALQTGTTMWNLTANGTLGTPAGGFNILNCNTSRMTITTSGNVGIGTTNPQRFLHLSNTDNTYFRINSPSTNQAVMEFNYNEQNVLCWQIGRQAGAPAGTTGPLFIYSQVKPGTLVEFYHTGDVNFAYNVGIGTSNPQAQLHLSNGGANTAIRLDSPSTNQCAINFVENNAGRTWQIGKQVGIPSGYTGEFYIYSQVLNAAPFSAYHNGNVKFYSSMVIGGVAAPSTATLQVINPNSGENNHFFVDGVTGQLRMFAGTAFAGMKYVRTANTTVGQPLYFNTNGIGIGTSNPQAPLTILGGISNCLNLEFGGNNLGIGPQIGFTANAGSAPMCAIRGALMITGGSGDAGNMIFSTRLNGTSALSDRMIILSNGLVGVNCNSPTATLTVNGSVSKTSGSFDIPHPIKKGYRLVHSFIEGPRVDLIYRGKKQLSNGTIMVDLEKEATANGSVMSPGTFDALCTNAEVFLQNNDTFDRVKGHVSSHILTIESENPVSAATINWMVIAERKDPSIKEWNMTDSNGFLVLEYASPSP